jgi:glucose-6-phosphate-specific signal transduction histidine kinase
MEIRNRRAFVAGAAFLAFALIYLWMSSPLEPGNTARMGPGYFPRMLSALLTLLGLMVMAGALRPTAVREGLGGWDLRSLAWITGSIALFAFLLDVAGFLVALVVLLLVASLASREFTWRGTLLSIVVLTVLAVMAFHYGLGLQFDLLPSL